MQADRCSRVSERVLVTGAAGFLGAWTLEPLRARGLEVHAVSRRPPEQARRAVAAVGASDGGAVWHSADLLERGRPAELVDAVRPDLLVHLAWCTEHGAYWSSPENVLWVEASLELLRAFAASGGRRAVVAGSCAEYSWTDGMPLREGETPLSPATLYGAAKHGLQVVATAAAEAWGIELAWARLFGLFGPGEPPERLVASLCRALLAGREAATTAASKRRDLLYVGDAGDALAALLSSRAEGPVNVGSGVGLEIGAIADSLGRIAGHEALVRPGALEARPDDPDVLLADTRRLDEEVGWVAGTTTERALAATFTWWRDAGDGDG